MHAKISIKQFFYEEKKLYRTSVYQHLKDTVLGFPGKCVPNNMPHRFTAFMV